MAAGKAKSTRSVRRAPASSAPRSCFFPHRNVRNKAAKSYARKLHNLRGCPIVIHYHTEENIVLRKHPITVLVSEYVEGELLTDFLKRQPGGRLQPFPALHLLHALVVGLECIHRSREFHGDLHSDNIIVERYGLTFDLKILDFFKWQAPKRDGYQHDLMRERSACSTTRSAARVSTRSSRTW